MTKDEEKTEDVGLAVQDRPRITLPEAKEFADIFVKSGFFSDTKDQAQAIVKILAGREIGIEPLTAMTGIHVIKGKVAIGANLMASAVKRSGRYDFKVIKHTEKECVIDFYENGAKAGTSSYTVDEAARAGLNMDMWKKYPKNMCFARAMSNGVKWYCPDVFGCTVYTPEELRDDKKKGEDSPIQEAEYREATPQPIKTDDPAISTHTTVPPEEAPKPPQTKWTIKLKDGLITPEMAPRKAYMNIQEHCFRTGQSATMNEMIATISPDGDYAYQIPESACAKMVFDITGIRLKLVESTLKCQTCDNLITEPESKEQDGLCRTCFEKRQDRE